jgi:uncharacterized protein (DUF1810 family)
MSIHDGHNLKRFITAQDGIYEHALAELKAGQKRSHWMWFVFPQIKGLGYSPNSEFYAIKSKAEAQAYLQHPILGTRLRECTQALLDFEGKSALEIFGSPDDVKLKSSMTLFAYISESGSIFTRTLDKYFGGNHDWKTIEFLKSDNILSGPPT